MKQAKMAIGRVLVFMHCKETWERYVGKSVLEPSGGGLSRFP